MMKYVVYVLVALLIAWALYVMIRHMRRASRGEGCGHCGEGCDGNCAGCAHSCAAKDKK